MSDVKARTKREFIVYIIESPSPVDLYCKRSESTVLTQALDLADIYTVERLAVDRTAFFAALTTGLKDYIESDNPLPIILHISAHGFEKGIQLTSKEIIEWDTLREYIAPLNKAINKKLIICLSSCQGMNACRMAMTEDDIPFLALVSHSGKPIWSDTAIGFAVFYNLMAKGYYVEEAVEGMRAATKDEFFHQIEGSEAKKRFIAKLTEIRQENLLQAIDSLIQKNK